MTAWRYLVFSLLLSLSVSAQGLKTVRPTILYDGPSVQAKPTLILSGAHPVKQGSRVHGWRKVFTHAGDDGWVVETDVQPARSVVVIVGQATVRVDPHPEAEAAFFASHGLVLDILKRVDKTWLQVVHEDGEVGYVIEADVWLNF